MKKCKHCNQNVSEYETYHDCPRAGLLNISKDDSFLVSTLIGAATGSALLGGLLGGDIVGGILGDLFDGDLMD